MSIVTTAIDRCEHGAHDNYVKHPLWPKGPCLSYLLCSCGKQKPSRAHVLFCSKGEISQWHTCTTGAGTVLRQRGRTGGKHRWSSV